MKRFLILFIIAIALSLLIAVGVSHDPGYVRVSYGNWLIESNLWMMLVAIGVLIGVTIILLNTKKHVVNTGKAVTGWLGKSSRSRAISNTEKGLIALLEGNWGNATKLLSKSAKKSQKPLINYLAAAHAANEQGNVKDAETLLKQAYETDTESDFAVGIAQAQIQLQQEQLEPCLATLIRLNKQQAHHPYVLKLLKSVYLRLEDWSQLIKLIPELKKHTNADSKRLDELERLSWTKQFTQKTDELINRNQKDSADEILANMWSSVPDSLRYDEELVDTYARQLIRIGQGGECETLLRKVLKKHWSDRLVRLYGMIEGDNPSEQLLNAENWLKERPNNTALLLALGRLSLQNHLWGKAQEYFEASLKLEDSNETLAELCRLKLKTKHSLEDTSEDISALLGRLSLPELPLPASKL